MLAVCEHKLNCHLTMLHAKLILYFLKNKQIEKVSSALFVQVVSGL